ncbi:MAG: alpha/beta hydrolase [Actinomycetota bacterium]
MDRQTSPVIDVDLAQKVKAADRPFRNRDQTVVVFRGEADSVHLVTWMPRFPDPGPFLQVKKGLWCLPVLLPATARIEYRLAVVRSGHSQEISDPLNPPTAGNPFGTNSVLTGNAYRPPPYMTVDDPGGHLFEIRVASNALGGRRHHHVYLPAGCQANTVAGLVLIHDGSGWLRYGGLAASLDRLIERGDIAPVAAVLLDPWQRIAEYGANPFHSQHLAEELLPHLDRRLRLRFPANRTAVMGSSLGAVASLSAAYHYPDRFGLVASISGSYAHRTDAEWAAGVFDPVVAFLRQFDPSVLGESSIYQSVGRYEGLVDFHRRLAPILRSGGARLHTVETWTGHDWLSWRDRLGEAFAFLFPGPVRFSGP